MRSEQVNELIIGVINDFGGFLTTESGTLITGSIHNASAMVEKISKFLKLRGVETKSMSCDLKWEEKCIQRKNK